MTRSDVREWEPEGRFPEFGEEDIDEREVSDEFGEDGFRDQAYVPSPLPEPEDPAKLAALSSSERIARLFEGMYAGRQTLLAILSACREAQAFESISNMLEGSRKGAWTVFTADNYLNMLVEAGALEMVTHEGKPYVETETGPVEVVRDGKVFLEVVEPPEVFWRTTDAGLTALADNDPMHELEGLFAKRAYLRPSLAVLLGMCARAGGADINALKAAINDRPEMRENNKTAQFLIDDLLNVGAVRYDAGCAAWRTTENGERALRILNGNEG